MSKRALVWFRNDLRTMDHEPLYRAASDYDEILPVYCFDPRYYDTSRYGFQKTGAHRAQFIIESVKNLRANLKAKGSTLLVGHEDTCTFLQSLIKQYQPDAILAHHEPAPDEKKIEQAIEEAIQIPLHLFWGTSLYHPEDVPFTIAELPTVFSQFRKPVEKKAEVRGLFELPSTLPTIQDAESGHIPDLEALGLNIPPEDDRAVLTFTGGEDAAMRRLNDYFWEGNHLKNYKYTRNGLLGADYSSKFSPWLAVGAISPRQIYYQVKQYEEQRKKNVSTYWMVFELLWRDFFFFSMLKYQDEVFAPGGLRDINQDWRDDRSLFRKWADARTGIPFVDANMRELNQTGYMSNRGRQNVASFLAQNLNIDWRLGAAYFERTLLDYDVSSNWLNWAHNSRAGLDPRNRYFNIVNQSKKYDKKGEYIKTWLPELSNLPAEQVHEPWVMNDDSLRLCAVEPGVDYPRPVINLEESYARIRQDRKTD